MNGLVMIKKCMYDLLHYGLYMCFGVYALEC